tara:strand:- start:1369 stop:1917 length:549 start_codon:yes stop_codon:yes gene_type:complete
MMKAEDLNYIKQSIKAVPDYPKKGIMFRDITSLIEDHKAFDLVIQAFAQHFGQMGFDKVVGTEARGFIFGAPLALELGIGFVPVRKPGKLPRETLARSYQLEYGEDTLEIHKDAIKSGEKVLVVDDLLATGGTIEATVALIRQLGGVVEQAAFVISLPDLSGEKKLQDLDVMVTSLCDFAGD